FMLKVSPYSNAATERNRNIPQEHRPQARKVEEPRVRASGDSSGDSRSGHRYGWSLRYHVRSKPDAGDRAKGRVWWLGFTDPRMRRHKNAVLFPDGCASAKEI